MVVFRKVLQVFGGKCSNTALGVHSRFRFLSTLHQQVRENCSEAVYITLRANIV